jgi:hypothetical protein
MIHSDHTLQECGFRGERKPTPIEVFQRLFGYENFFARIEIRAEGVL